MLGALDCAEDFRTEFLFDVGLFLDAKCDEPGQAALFPLLTRTFPWIQSNQASASASRRALMYLR